MCVQMYVCVCVCVCVGFFRIFSVLFAAPRRVVGTEEKKRDQAESSVSDDSSEELVDSRPKSEYTCAHCADVRSVDTHAPTPVGEKWRKELLLQNYAPADLPLTGYLCPCCVEWLKRLDVIVRLLIRISANNRCTWQRWKAGRRAPRCALLTGLLLRQGIAL
jgi:hypothetical protein